MKERTSSVNLKEMLPYLVGVLFIAFAMFFASNIVSAATDGQTVATELIQQIINILGIICNILGVIFALFGFVKLIIAQANEDGPSQQRSVTMLAVGVVLVIVGLIVLPNMKNSVSSWIDFSANS